MRKSVTAYTTVSTPWSSGFQPGFATPWESFAIFLRCETFWWKYS